MLATWRWTVCSLSVRRSATRRPSNGSTRPATAPACGPVLRRAGGSALEPAAVGVDGALGRLVAIVHGAVANGTWAHLKACERGRCRWAFYDHSKNHSGRWCDMDVCGAKEKSARAYRRRRASDSAKRS